MKKNLFGVIAVFLCLAFALSALTACDINVNVGGSSTEPSALPELSSEIEPSSETEPSVMPELSSEVEPSSEIELVSEIESSSETSTYKKRDLTLNELLEIEEILSPSGVNNGFVACLYKKASKIDLNSVFYVGAGIDKSLTDKDKNALMDEHGWSEELFDNVGVDKLKKSDMESFIKKRTGLKLKSFGEIRDFVYCKSTDAYYHAHGDTNAVMIEVESGTVDSDGVYTVVYENETGFVYDGSDFKMMDDMECVVKFTLSGKTPKFISNTLKK